MAMAEAGEGRGRGPLGRAFQLVVDGLAALGTVMIAGLMVVIVADVLARNITGGSLPLVAELGALMVVMIVFLQLGTTVRHNRLARTDIVLGLLAASRPRAALALEGVFSVVGCLVCAVIARQTFDILKRDIEIGEYIGVTGVLTVETWPFRLLIFVGIVVAALQFALRAGTEFYGAATGRSIAR